MRNSAVDDYSRFLRVALAGLVIAGIQSCGSSSDTASVMNDQSVSFVDPVDAQTLRAALITGDSSEDSEEFWLCTVPTSDQVLGYRLYADGSGTEIDLANPNVIFPFTWQTTSATTFTSTSSSGGEIILTEFQFSGQNNMNFVLSDSFATSCERQFPVSSAPVMPDVPVENNSLSYSGTAYLLTHGFEEAFRFRPTRPGDPTTVLDTHVTSQFEVADALFSITQIIVSGNTISIARPNDASVWLRADVHSPGGEGFETATFEYRPDSVDERGPEVSGIFFFNEAAFGIDTNGDGRINSDDNEFIDVTGGTITVARMANTTASMSFDLTLADGTTLTGSFQGTFPIFNH